MVHSPLYNADMGWVSDCLYQSKTATQHVELKHVDSAQNIPPWQDTWDRVCEQITNDVLEFNLDRGPQFMVSKISSTVIQVIPKQPPTDTAVFEIDPRTGVLQVTCPISHEGVPRRGQFKVTQDAVASLGSFVGQPQPPEGPMTPEQFSGAILKPLLFPNLTYEASTSRQKPNNRPAKA